MFPKKSPINQAQNYGPRIAAVATYAPGPGEFNNDNWEIVGMHMQVRANIIQPDIDKIIEFLKSTNN